VDQELKERLPVSTAQPPQVAMQVLTWALNLRRGFWGIELLQDDMSLTLCLNTMMTISSRKSFQVSETLLHQHL
jgi:hypothetical protein